MANGFLQTLLHFVPPLAEFVFIVYFLYCCGLGFVVIVTESCLTLCDPMDCSPSGSSVHGISQARGLERVAVSFSRGLSQPKAQSHGPKIDLMSRAFQAESLPLSHQGSPYLLYNSLKSLNFCLNFCNLSRTPF